MDASVSSARPRKRRRRHNYALMEDDIETADAFILESVIQEGEDGPEEEFMEIPVWTNRPEPNTLTQDVRPEAKTKTRDVQQVEESTVPPVMPEWEDDAAEHERAGGQGRTRYSRVSRMIMDTTTTVIVQHRHSKITSNNS